MKNQKFWLVLASLLCAAAIATALPTTLAYIIGSSNTVHNTFRVEYLPPQDVTVPVTLSKTLLCTGGEDISPEGFSFSLENKETGEITTLTTLADGLAAANLTYTADDVGKTFTYRLSEINDGRENVVYDKIAYEITVTIQLNEQHEITPVLLMDGEPVTEIMAEFLNVYDVEEIPDVPDTGDHDQPLLCLWLLMISGAGLVLLSRKERANGRQ